MKAFKTISTGSAIGLMLYGVPIGSIIAPPQLNTSDACAAEATPDCLDTGHICTFTEGKCCDGLFCIGYGFYKKCAEPPVCLLEWYDCSSGTKCCDGLACTITSDNVYECKKPKIGTRTIEIPPGGANLVSNSTPTSPTPTNPIPAPTPSPPKNLITTKVPGNKTVARRVACASGDPHITTFDGLRYDCQGVGEHILVKSLITQREVQARFEPLNGKAITVGKGVAIQDEGDTPRVELTLAKLPDTLGNKVTNDCTFLFFVDGEQRDLTAGSGDPRVSVVWKGSTISVKYNESQLEVTLSFSNSSCRMSYCVSLPENDNVVGMLGTPNGNISDEWKLPNGTIIPLPTALADKVKKPGYDFCTNNFCLLNKTKSLFVYPEDGIDFDYFQKCGLPFGVTLEQYLGNVSQSILDLCGADLACIMDVKEGNTDDAKLLRSASALYSQTCNPTGGECDTSKCCGSIPCVDNGGLAGKVCGGNMTCAPEFGNCQTLGCCGNLTCTALKDGKSICLDERACQAEWMSCTEKSCCKGMICLDNFKGGKQCRKLPVCMKQWDDCSVVGCCAGMKCFNAANGGKQCQVRPDCWKDQWKDCTETPCCDGLTCIKKSGRNVCAKLPVCVPLGQSCEWSPCCDDPFNPLQCVNVIDSTGQEAKQCRYVPGNVEVRVFNDLNANGIQDANEPGIENVTISLYDESTKTLLPSHSPLASDVNGIVLFTEVPKGKTLRVQVISRPDGAVPTKSNQGGNEVLDSDLQSNGVFTDTFRVFNTSTWNNTDIGLLLPNQFQVNVFNDLNSNGFQDDEDYGMQGVTLRLITFAAGQTNGTDLVSDANGIVQFPFAKQNVKYRVAVIDAPKGAIPTKANAGDDTRDSDLGTNMMSDEFTILGGQSAPKLSFGFRLPESVFIRVWNDANANGLQDVGESGVPGVKLCLVKDDTNKTRLPSQNNGGNAHEDVVSDADGNVVFTKVPQGLTLRAKVLEPPLGAIPTGQNVGPDAEKNSDLGSDGLSDSFAITKSGVAFTEIDLGYKFPSSLIVRVWDDSNGNGVQEDGEPGIAGVALRVVEDNVNRTNLPNQNNGGNAHEELVTNDQGLATFTLVPPSKSCRVKVTNAPPGASITQKNLGGDEEKDSDLGTDSITDAFTFTQGGDRTNIDIGYRMPTQVVVRVWDDLNSNYLQDDGEPGVSNVTLRIIKDADKSYLPDQLNGGNAHEEITTDENGFATFNKVPKGIRLAVKVTNYPVGAIRTYQLSGSANEERDSDLRADSTSDAFDLSTFAGSSFGSIDLGYLLPHDVQVRVWDDINVNGYQDSDELGISNVTLRLIYDSNASNVVNQGNGGTADQELATDENGLVTFTKVPKGQNLRVKVTNPPIGAVSTTQNAGGNGNETVDSDLRTDMTSDYFNLNSFGGAGPYSSIDLGFRMPCDVQVRVWDDINGNGRQDAGEPGIEGVLLRLANDDTNRTAVANIGGGSTAHLQLLTDENGTVTFVQVPKNRNLRVKVLNAPTGSIRTGQNVAGGEEGDSDLGSDLISDVFNLNSFTTRGVYGLIDLGFRMPKSVLVRVWNDKNKNGVQEDSEDGIGGVGLQLVLSSNGANLTDQNNGGNAHTVLYTEADGRVTFTRVPQAILLKVKVVKPPANATVTTKNLTVGNQLNSDLNTNGLTDQFQLPNDATQIFDSVDCGYILK